MSRKYQLVLTSSLVDEEFAPDLIHGITENVANGTIDAELTLIANLATEVKILKEQFGHYDEKDFYRRYEYVKGIVKNSIFFDSNEFYRTGKGWRRRHDERLQGILSEIKPDSVLNLGYMLLISEVLWKAFPIVTLHPAIPEVGPVGVWPKVMQEQAERPLKEIGALKESKLPEEKVTHILRKGGYKAGGMLLLVDDTIDRGLVISYYDFSLTSPELLQLFWIVANVTRDRGIEEARKTEEYRQVVKTIRDYQYPGEKPLIFFTYDGLTHDRQKIARKDGLWAPQPSGYCLNKEIGEWLRERGVKSLIM